MANSYYNQGNPIARFITADATRINQELQAIQAGFDKLPSISELNSGSRGYSVATGTANSYSVTLPFPLPSYNAGLEVTVLIPVANTIASTISINGLPAVQIRRFDGTVLQNGDLRTLSINKMTFDGTNFRLTSVHGSAELLATTSATNASASASNASTSASQAANSALSASNSASIATAASSNTTTALSSARFGFRNLLCNSLWWFSQRYGYLGVDSDASVVAGTYFRDRWKAGGSGLTFRISSSTLNIISGSAVQIVQGRNIPQTGTYTLSWEGTAAASVNGINVPNGGQVTLNGYEGPTVTFTAGTVLKPQLEFSSTKSQYEFRPIDIERQICLQYFQKSYSDFTNPGTATLAGAYHGVCVSIVLTGNPTVQLQCPMRSSPVITIWNPYLTGISGNIHDIDANVQLSYSIAQVSDRSFIIYRGIHDFTVGNRINFHWTADAEL